MDQEKISGWKTEIQILIDTTLAEVPESLFYEEQKGRMLEHYMSSLESLMSIERMVMEHE